MRMWLIYGTEEDLDNHIQDMRVSRNVSLPGVKPVEETDLCD